MITVTAILLQVDRGPSRRAWFSVGNNGACVGVPLPKADLEALGALPNGRRFVIRLEEEVAAVDGTGALYAGEMVEPCR